MSDAVPVLLVTVFESVIEVFLLCTAGYVLSRAGVTDKATQRKLNVINVSLFTPALLFSKVAFSLTPAKLKEMWIIPLGFVLITGVSAAVAWIMAKIFKLKKSQTAFAICAAMFQNSNSLPIALIQSLVVEVPGLKWGDDDSKDQMLGRALTYLVLYSTLGMMLRWSYGVKLLSQADDEIPDIPSATEPILPNHQGYTDDPSDSPEAIHPHPGARETDPFFSSQDGISRDEADERRSRSQASNGGRRVISPDPSPAWTAASSVHPLLPPARGTSLTRRGSNQSQSAATRRKPTRTESGREFWGLPQFPKQERIMLPIDSEDSSDDDEEEDEEWGNLSTPSLRRRIAPPAGKVKLFGRKLKVWFKAAWKSINAFLTVPMWAALLSIFIAMIPPLQAFIGKIKPFEQAVRSAGQCSIPVTLVVLGAFFYSPPTPSNQTVPPPPQQNQHLASIPESPNNDSTKGFFERKLGFFKSSSSKNNISSAYPGENKAVFVAVVSRMIIVPALMLPFIALIARYDMFEAAEDPVFILSAVLLVSSPPALTLAQITQAASGDAFERLISKTISWSYAVLTPPLTLVYVVIGLVFGRL